MKLELSLRLATLALLAPLALAPLGCDGGDEGEDEVADTETTDADTTADTETGGGPDLANGQAIHDNNCAVAGCHGDADPVQLSERVPMLDDAALEAQIRNGGNGMPGFNETLISPEDLVDLIAFLRDTYG